MCAIVDVIIKCASYMGYFLLVVFIGILVRGFMFYRLDSHLISDLFDYWCHKSRLEQWSKLTLPYGW